MRIKCCGLKYHDNTLQVEATNVDYLGFIFYPGSKRMVYSIPRGTSTAKRVGVFVNENRYSVLETCGRYDLDYAQLHGDESPEYIKQISEKIKTIKAFSMHDDFSFDVCDAFTECSLFVFDTKGSQPGGNGKKFNWEILNNYSGEIPFLLSGGIQLNDVPKIREINHPKMIGVDINSGFETSPGVKNTAKILNFKTKLNEI